MDECMIEFWFFLGRLFSLSRIGESDPKRVEEMEQGIVGAQLALVVQSNYQPSQLSRANN